MPAIIQQTDTALFQWANSWAFWRPWADALIVFRAEYLPYFAVIGLFLFGLFSYLSMFPRSVAARKKNWRMIFEALAAGLAARFMVAELIRWFYNRPRPFEMLTNVRQLITHSPGGSFPSGHSVFFFAIAAVVGCYYPKTSILFYLAAISLSFARVVAGIHWSSDVIFGAFIGIAVGLLTHTIFRKYSKPKTAL